MKICIIAGSSGKNLELAQKFQDYFTSRQISSEIIDVVKLNLPLYTSESEKNHKAEELVASFHNQIKANGFVFLAPEYNGGLPPAFSNFLAWVSRSTKEWRENFNGHPAVIGTFSGGPGSNLLTILRLQLSYLGMNVVGRTISVHSQKELDQSSLEAVCSQLLKLANPS